MKWTDEQRQFIRKNADNMTYKEMGAALGRSGKAVGQYARKMGIIKKNNAGQFSKGDPAWNKGKKQADYMSDEAIERTKKTRFKAGQEPANTLFDGAITMRQKDHPSGPYLWIRITQGEWKLLHQYRWEQVHGAVPDGHIVVFKDGNSLDPHPDNLECITRAENIRRNRDWQKAMKTMRRRGNHPSKNLTDAYVAAMLAGGDKEIKQHLLDERPDIIRLARANYKLKRKINDGKND